MQAPVESVAVQHVAFADLSEIVDIQEIASLSAMGNTDFDWNEWWRGEIPQDIEMVYMFDESAL